MQSSTSLHHVRSSDDFETSEAVVVSVAINTAQHHASVWCCGGKGSFVHHFDHNGVHHQHASEWTLRPEIKWGVKIASVTEQAYSDAVASTSQCFEATAYSQGACLLQLKPAVRCVC